MSGSLQGAGGIGGLLARADVVNGQWACYHADGNGNVTALVNGQQIIVAKYIYDPFGNTLAKSGPLADANTYRFSSQEYHQNSGLVLYLYRAYDPNLQRWQNRDPIGERGGLNLYGFVGNDPIGGFDPLGFSDQNAPPSRVSPKTLERLDKSVDGHPGGLWGDWYGVQNPFGAYNCTSWACARLRDAGLIPPSNPDLPFLNPWSNQNNMNQGH